MNDRAGAKYHVLGAGSASAQNATGQSSNEMIQAELQLNGRFQPQAITPVCRMLTPFGLLPCMRLRRWVAYLAVELSSATNGAACGSMAAE